MSDTFTKEFSHCGIQFRLTIKLNYYPSNKTHLAIITSLNLPNYKYEKTELFSCKDIKRAVEMIIDGTKQIADMNCGWAFHKSDESNFQDLGFEKTPTKT